MPLHRLFAVSRRCAASRVTLTALLAAFACVRAAAGPIPFDFADPKGTNAVAILIDAPIEPISGYADGITGVIQFDPDNPKATTGKISIAVASVTFPNAGYTRTARSDYGLGGAAHPQITFTLKRVVSVTEPSPRRYVATVEADFTCKGKTKTLTVPVTASYLPDKAQVRGDIPGDVLKIRTEFTLRRPDFDIAPGVPKDLVSEEIEVRLAVVGLRLRPGAAKPAPGKGKAEDKKDAKKDESKPMADARRTPDGNGNRTLPDALTISVDGKPQSVEERMRHYRVPGLTLAWIQDFAVREVRHFGVVEAGSATPVDAATLFPAAEMSGPVATAAALRWIQQGRLDWDRPLNAVLRGWRVPDSPLTQNRPVTLRDLLTQRSGFTFRKYTGYPANSPLPTRLQILNGEPPATNPPARIAFTPGTQHQLASENFTVLEQLLSDAAGKPFPEVMRETIIAPFGEALSRYAARPSGAAGVRFAAGHDEAGKPLPDGGMAFPELAANGLWTNAREYADFVADLMRAAAGREAVLLDKKHARLLLEPFMEGQTMGFGQTKRGETNWLFRGGYAAGFFCHTDILPEKGCGVVIMANGDLCWRLTNELRDSLGKQLGWDGF